MGQLTLADAVQRAEAAAGDVVLSLCDYSGNMVRPWAKAGYPCICVDIKTERADEYFESGGSISYVEADLFDYLPPLRTYRIVFAFPDCTNLAVSGAQWYQLKGLAGLSKGIALVERCAQIAQWSTAPYMIENPVGVLSSYWRDPDYIFQPWEYGDLESKRTCLWTGGGFIMPEGVALKPDGVKESVWRMSPSPNRGRRRSITAEGFAQKVFEANQR